MQPDLPRIGARVWRRMQAAASRRVASGEMSPSVAQGKLRYWLAIAAHAGADLDELWQPCIPIVHSGPEPALEHVRIFSSAIASRAEWAPVLGEARDAVLERHHSKPTPESEAAARDLCALAWAFAFDPAGRHPIPPYGATLRRAA